MSPATEQWDVVVIGAGAAGLAAAVDLESAGLRVLVMEARERIGGRIFTLRDPLHAVPIECGAEFVHGRPRAIWDIVREARLRTYEAAESWWQSDEDGLRLDEGFWDRLSSILRAAEQVASDDMTLREALDRLPASSVSPEDRQAVTSFVEGFHAVDPDRISMRALAREGLISDDKAEDRSFRFVDGYDSLIRALVQRLQAAPLTVRLNRVAREVHWRAGFVEVHCYSRLGFDLPTAQARAAVITLPLGVLKAPPEKPGAVIFFPPLPEKTAALTRLHSGSVYRVVLRFRFPFWEGSVPIEGQQPRGAPGLAFAHRPEAVFPTWWTAMPIHSPILTGWVGGPGAERLTECTSREIVDEAVLSLSRVLRVSPNMVMNTVESWYLHDWQADPFSRGAYSYPGVGGLEAQQVLARPESDTLFFAGEATHIGGQSGTVDGAIASGRRAAGEVVASLSNQRFTSWNRAM